MKVVALTGRSGCGKSTVAALWRQQGYPVIDCDEIARLVVEPGSSVLSELAEAFGSDVLDETGVLRRDVLAQRAFSSPERAEVLTGITHPAIIREICRRLDDARQSGASIAVVDGAVIIGAPFERFCDEFVVVTAPAGVSAARIAARDGISEERAMERLGSQIPEKVLRERADYLIENTGTKAQLCERARQVLAALTGEL